MVLQLKIFLSLFSLGMCLSTRVRNLRPMSVLTFLLNWDQRDDSRLLMPAGMFFVGGCSHDGRTVAWC